MNFSIAIYVRCVPWNQPILKRSITFHASQLCSLSFLPLPRKEVTSYSPPCCYDLIIFKLGSYGSNFQREKNSTPPHKTTSIHHDHKDQVVTPYILWLGRIFRVTTNTVRKQLIDKLWCWNVGNLKGNCNILVISLDWLLDRSII